MKATVNREGWALETGETSNATGKGRRLALSEAKPNKVAVHDRAKDANERRSSMCTVQSLPRATMIWVPYRLSFGVHGMPPARIPGQYLIIIYATQINKRNGTSAVLA
jgi:hypothetical protein